MIARSTLGSADADLLAVHWADMVILPLAALLETSLVWVSVVILGHYLVVLVWPDKQQREALGPVVALSASVGVATWLAATWFVYGIPWRGRLALEGG